VGRGPRVPPTTIDGRNLFIGQLLIENADFKPALRSGPFVGRAIAIESSCPHEPSALTHGLSLRASEYDYDFAMWRRPRFGSVLIRIIKRLPAPMMDGFDVRGFQVDRDYEVEHPVGRYLVIAGYAEPLDETARDGAKRRRGE
jgi:hypothetical protein